jgi:beta-mannosidase
VVNRHSRPGTAAELSGSWRAHVGDHELAKTFADPDSPDDTWELVQVPHHWRREPAFAESDGPVLYRHSFTDAPPDAATRSFLVLDGVAYYSDVWLDGEYLGAAEGMFAPHSFEITEALRTRETHMLAIEVSCPPQRDRSVKRTITAPYFDGPLLDPDLNPGGIWAPVRIVNSGPVRIARARVACIEASAQQGRLDCDVTLDAGSALDAQLRATVRGPNDVVLLESTRDVSLAAGPNELSWVLAVDEPPRWWPRELGPQHLCRLELTVEVDDTASDTLEFDTAFRDIRRDGDGFSVNGEHLFLKGASYGPARPLIGDIDAGLVQADIAAAIDANLNFLRVYTHVAPAVLYDAADRAGLLLWQDLPMRGGYARGIRRAAATQARAMVDLLAHHPSIFMWCAHDAPVGEQSTARVIAGFAAPTYAKDVLDRSVARAMRNADPTRPVLVHSVSTSDAHLWFGWAHGHLAGLAETIRAVPRLGTFVSAFGAQAVPETAEWLQPQQWPNLDWDTLAAHHGMDRRAFETHVPPGDAKTFDEWRDASQAYQAALLQLQIEDLRRCRGNPCAGFAMFTLVDPAPAVGFGVLDHERAPKRGYAALRDACRPVLAMVDPRTGAVHVVNDTRVDVTGVVVELTVDGRTRRFGGDVPADAIVYVGTVDLTDAVDVEVLLTHPVHGPVRNRYPLLLLEAGRRS